VAGIQVEDTLLPERDELLRLIDPLHRQVGVDPARHDHDFGLLRRRPCLQVPRREWEAVLALAPFPGERRPGDFEVAALWVARARPANAVHPELAKRPLPVADLRN